MGRLTLRADRWPGGATLDVEGKLWSAFRDGSRIARLNQDGGIEQKLMLLVPRVSSIKFGVVNYNHIHITTAGGNVRELDSPLAGALFRLKGHAKGVAENLPGIQARQAAVLLRTNRRGQERTGKAVQSRPLISWSALLSSLPLHAIPASEPHRVACRAGQLAWQGQPPRGNRREWP